MPMPASRITDMHVCPMFTGPVPHVGGPILPPGCPTVLIGGLPAARVTDMAVCVGPPDTIIKGAMTVLICSLPAARIGDSTVHGGTIILGLPTVLIGDAGGGVVGLRLDQRGGSYGKASGKAAEEAGIHGGEHLRERTKKHL